MNEQNNSESEIPSDRPTQQVVALHNLWAWTIFLWISNVVWIALVDYDPAQLFGVVFWTGLIAIEMTILSKPITVKKS